MTNNQTPYAPGCPVKGKHAPLPHLDIPFPSIADAPNQAKAITAFMLDCTPCIERHRGLAGQHSDLVHEALWLWLGTVAVTRVGMGMPPVATAADMMDGLFENLVANLPSLSEEAASPTLKVLQGIPLSTATAPQGLGNVWQQADAQRVLDALHPEHRELVWIDLLTLLGGWYQGTVRAHVDPGGPKT
ncbi:hypothetical protein ACFW2V_12270 [Streptomyces sp. NPDC058947]|uniref:hypothetical protein n=1 Tax=Streptomyces sp. NPDC058947 TaxID=3346675 RepID=UPI003690A548